MATHARAIKMHKATHPELQAMKEWAKRAFSKHRVAEIALAAITAAALVYVTGFLCRVAQSY